MSNADSASQWALWWVVQRSHVPQCGGTRLQSLDQSTHVFLWLFPTSIFDCQLQKTPLEGSIVPSGGLLWQDWKWTHPLTPLSLILPLGNTLPGPDTLRAARADIAMLLWLLSVSSTLVLETPVVCVTHFQPAGDTHSSLSPLLEALL